MQHPYTTLTVSLLLAALLGCGPSIRKQVRMDWQPYDEKEFRQEKDGIIVELKPTKDLPAYFATKVQACNEDGTAAFREEKDLQGVVRSRSPLVVDGSFADGKQIWREVAITNQTQKIVRLNEVVIRLVDPAGNSSTPVDKASVLAEFEGRFGCLPNNALKAATSKFASKVKLLERNTEIVPGETWSGWVAFSPPAADSPGMWKFTLYNVPVELDDAGHVKKTANFDLRTKLSKFRETYKDGKLVNTEELAE